MKTPEFLKKELKGTPLLAVVIMLNSATLWPIAYEIIDFVSGFLGFDSRYAAFHTMPILFWVAWVIFSLFVCIVAYKLTLSIASILAATSYNGNGKISTPNTVTTDFKDKNRILYSKIINICVVFVVTFGMAHYQLEIRLKQIQLENSLNDLKHSYEIHTKQYR